MKTRTKFPNWPTEPTTLANGSILHWDKAYRSARSYFFVPVTCGSCGGIRNIEATRTRRRSSGETFTGLCNACRRKTAFSHRGEQHPAWKGGTYTVGGYRQIDVSTLDPIVQDLIAPMRRKTWDGSYCISEHRLVMAQVLGRPLFRSEIVHHRNGNKLDNRPENLEITTHADHRRLDVKYYKLWVEAQEKIRELETRLSRYEGGAE